MKFCVICGWLLPGTRVSPEATTIGGCVVMENFAKPTLCAELLARVNDYRSRHAVPVIEGRNGELPLKYSVIDGD